MPSRAVLPLLALLALQLGCEKNPVHEEHPLNPQWTLLGLENSTIAAIAVDPTDRNIIYAGGSALFKSIDGGAVWDTLMKEALIRDIDIHPNKRQTVFVLGGFNIINVSEIIKTTDGGETWTQADSSIEFSLFEGPAVLVIDPLHPETLFFGTSGNFGGNIYKSTNGGQTWQSKGNALLKMTGVTAIAVDPKNADVLEERRCTLCRNSFARSHL